MPRTGLPAEQLREQAVQATLSRMRLVGVEKVRLSDVARDIGVSHAALYQHFTDKAALLDAATEYWLHTIDAAVQIPPTGEPEERIVEWLVTLYRTKRARVLDDPEPYQAFNLASAHDKPVVLAHVARLVGQLTELVEQARSSLGAGDAGTKAKLIYEATAVFHHPALLIQTAREDREPQLRQIASLLIRGMQLNTVRQQSRGRLRRNFAASRHEN